MNNNNKLVCNRFEKIINSPFVLNILNKYNKSYEDVVKNKENINTKLMNFLFIYIKLIDIDEYIEEDINTFLEGNDTLEEMSLNSLISRIIVNRMKKLNLDNSSIKDKIITELLENRLYIHYDYKNNTNQTEEEIKNIDKEINSFISVFSMYGLQKIFKSNVYNEKEFYYDTNFNNALFNSNVFPSWMYLLLGDSYIHKDKEESFKKINAITRKFDLCSKESALESYKKIWDYYEKYSYKTNIFVFEGKNINDINDIHFNWNPNLPETNNLEKLLNVSIKLNNQSTNKELNESMFKEIKLPSVDKLIRLNKEKELIK